MKKWLRSHQLGVSIQPLGRPLDNVDLDSPPSIEERIAYAMNFIRPVIFRVAVSIVAVIAADTIRQVVVAKATERPEVER